MSPKGQLTVASVLKRIDLFPGIILFTHSFSNMIDLFKLFYSIRKAFVFIFLHITLYNNCNLFL